jgi:hypothetical protein
MFVENCFDACVTRNTPPLDWYKGISYNGRRQRGGRGVREEIGRGATVYTIYPRLDTKGC